MFICVVFKIKMIYKTLQFIIILCQLMPMSKSAAILAVLPIPALSHQMVFRVLTHELVQRGHEVTIITNYPLYTNGPALTNYTEIDIHEASESVIKSLFTEKLKTSDEIVSQLETTYKTLTGVMDNVLQLKEVRNLIESKSKHFDLIFLEDCAISALIFTHIFKAPVIKISSFGGTLETFESIGAATHPFLYPLAVRKRYNNLSTWEKLLELRQLYRLQKLFDEHSGKELMNKYFGMNAPNIHDLQKNIHMLFLNIHPIWDSNRPVPPNVIYLGGLHQEPQQDLPKELQLQFDSSSNGIIYVSFGTLVNPALFTPDKLQVFINVFSKLNYDVYWKWDDESLPGLTKNIKVLKWFPQADVLRHPKVKLFITQGGLQSTDEAIAAGVPLIGIPMIYDQWFNVDKYVQLKIGLQLDIDSITEAKLKDAIKTVIEDKSYKENVIKLYSVMRDQPQSPLERAVWWTEYVIRNRGARHLSAPTANITWVEYYEIKLILFITTLVILIFAVTSLIIFRTFHVFVRKMKID